MKLKKNHTNYNTPSCSVKVFKFKEKERYQINIIDKTEKDNSNNTASVYLSTNDTSGDIKDDENDNLLIDCHKSPNRKSSGTTILGETKYAEKIREEKIGNINLAITFLNRFGLFYSLTASIIITGIKPLINIIYMIIFIERSKMHTDMLKKMDDLDLSFRSAFKVSPNVKPYKIVFILAILITIIVTTTLRIIEHAATQQGTYYFSKQFIFSLIVIPLLSIWNLIPLLYYEICNRLVRFWCRNLAQNIERETQSRKFTIRFYYEQFLKITKLQRSMGNTFNPFIFFCLAWSLILLCFTIYLSTEKIDNLVEPLPDLSRNNISEKISRRILTQRVIFTLLWTAVQVVLSLINIFVICATGMKTNEQTRKIVNAILGVVPIIETESDRFQVQCFIHKMQTQYIWGMNVWRTVPLERTTFFTIVSVIVTYSVLLFKLQESRQIAPSVQKGINITQS
ncbi:Hypothetical protein SRAE_0000016600 [Strongyloides ratti]|uniref:Gustatory receptor n=1 Tax=Strongyloides ratti TaxID=34506 RepID=A0A090KUE1_STRRB|nr:Hypothetical protein SRAE_0000016600 [Strongyloides ratti]CEF61036.1 Hypothetical protein SRAE_0000016600 [Strongyloides ratti]